jgi:hypothetical protein
MVERLRIKIEAFRLLSELECNELLLANKARFRALVVSTREDVEALKKEVLAINVSTNATPC